MYDTNVRASETLVHGANQSSNAPPIQEDHEGGDYNENMMLEEAIQIVSSQMRDEEHARASNTVALSQQLVLAANDTARSDEPNQEQAEETLEFKLDKAVDCPVIATVVEIPSDLTHKSNSPND